MVAVQEIKEGIAKALTGAHFTSISGTKSPKLRHSLSVLCRSNRRKAATYIRWLRIAGGLSLHFVEFGHMNLYVLFLLLPRVNLSFESHTC